MESLHGILVLDLSRLLPGPFCSMVLADHGARVIAIEDRRFEKDGFFFDEVNRNKEHMTLNLKIPEGKAVFFHLASKADIIIEGFRPGVVKRLGVDYEAVKKIKENIIYCSITGYGQDGPFHGRAGHDINFVSHAGLLDLMGKPDQPPSIPGVPIADIAGGGMNAAIGILLALIVRDRTGKGQYIDISMTDGLLGFLTAPLFLNKMTGKPPIRSNHLLSHRYACYNTYETGDGRYISIGALEHRFWKVLCEHLNVPEYIPVQYDEEKRNEIIDCMRRIFKKKSLSEWERDLGNLDVCWSPIRNLEEVMEDPLFQARDMIQTFQYNNGDMRKTFGVPVKMSETPGSLRTPPAAFGEHTRNILAEFGYSDSEIEKLEKKGVV